MHQYLRPTDILDCDHPEVRDLAATLAQGASGPVEIAKRSSCPNRPAGSWGLVHRP
jgi:hypothetical protein